MNKTIQDINLKNMDIELVAQMFKNYQSNVLFHLEGIPSCRWAIPCNETETDCGLATDNLNEPS